MLPRVAHENLVKMFNFRSKSSVYLGMAYEGKLYTLVKSFDAHARIHAHALGCRLAAKRIRSVITVSKAGDFKVWAGIRSDNLLQPFPLEDFADEPTPQHTLLVTE